MPQWENINVLASEEEVNIHFNYIFQYLNILITMIQMLS